MKASQELEARNPILLTTEVERSGEGHRMDMRNIQVKSKLTKVKTVEMSFCEDGVLGKQKRVSFVGA